MMDVLRLFDEENFCNFCLILHLSVEFMFYIICACQSDIILTTIVTDF